MNVVIDMLKNRNKASYVNGGERRKRRTAGFTMAEMLIVIAIIGVLAAVSFIAVQAHQKSMTQLEYDAIAKEIYIAAQNHLTLAKSENYRQVSDLSTALDKTIGSTYFFGSDGNAPADGDTADIRYFYSDDDNTSTALEQILPFGAVELVTGGRFIIRYQPIAARVLDVFYWTDGSDRYDANLKSDSYATLVGSADSATDRHKNYKGSGLLGWCGGEGIVVMGSYLNAPEIEVINKEMLLVKVTDNRVKATDVNSDTAVESKLKLIVTGSSSGAKVAIPLARNSNTDRVKDSEGIYTVVLDDITTEKMHFSKLKDKDMEKMPTGTRYNEKIFIPGENITIQAVAYSDTSLTSVAYSGEWTTNSLFGEVSEKSTTVSGKTVKTADTVYISNIRHLENLNDSLSIVDYNDNYFSNDEKDIKVVQTTNLYWNDKDEQTDDFVSQINERKGTTGAVKIYSGSNATKDNCFLPVSTSYKLTYNGQSEVTVKETPGTGENAQTTEKTIVENHSIEGITVDHNADAGLFGTFAVKGSAVSNLKLIDFNITTSSGNAGALAGSLTDTTVTNVVAYHSDGKADSAKITATSGSAGGLIGSIAGETSVSKSAAALIVSATGGNAGGLIGTAEGGTISACYSGGHTMEKKNGTGDKAEVIGVIYDPDNFNVTGSAYAGGLIGEAGAATISNSYSTCSAKGKNVGGLVGKASGTITNSYCTGLVGVIVGSDGKPVSGTSAGAFAAECTGTTNGCSYFGIVNEFEDETLGYDYLTALPKVGTGDGSKEGVTALDADANAYNTFTSVWSDAVPYLKTTLMSYYGEGTGTARIPKYNLKSVEQLAGTLKADDNDTTEYFVATHYGDWPAPEIFVVNTKSSN